MDQFKRRMDGGIKICLEIDKMEKDGKAASMKSIVEMMKKFNFEEDEVIDILFSLTRQGTLKKYHDVELNDDIYSISR